MNETQEDSMPLDLLANHPVVAAPEPENRRMGSIMGNEFRVFQSRSTTGRKTGIDEDQIETLIYMAGAGSKKEGLGIYQKKVALVMIMTINTIGFFFYGLSFWERIPEYQCIYHGFPDQWQSCTAEETCDMDKYGVSAFRIDPDDEFSFENLAQQLDLQCRDKNEIGLIGSFVFIGWAAGCIVIPPFADTYGRRRPFLMALVLQLIVYPFILLTKNILLMYALCVLFGIGIAGIYTVGYVFYVENLPKSHRVKAGLIIDFSQAAVIIYVALYLQFISKNWLYLQYFVIAQNAIGLIIAFFYVFDTPRYLLEKGRRDLALVQLRRMALINGKLEEFETYVNDHQIKFYDESAEVERATTIQEQETGSIIKEFKNNATFRRNLLIMSFVWIATSIDYYLINFYLKYLKGNMFLNSNVAALAECLSTIMAGYLYLNFGLKMALFVSFAISVVGSVLIMFLEKSNPDWVPVFILLAKYGIGSAFAINYVSNFIFPVRVAS